MSTRNRGMLLVAVLSGLLLAVSFSVDLGCQRTVTPEPTREVITNSLGMKLVLIPAGEFMMGSPNSEEGAIPDEHPQHRVKITQPFYLGATEVTQEQYERVMGENPSHFKGDPQRPVETVSWEDAVEFCRRLSEKEAKTYRLPTEAEWEYACRAGSTTKWCFGDSESKLRGYAWFGRNSSYTTHSVGQKKANAWGLYDMHGNVWEWCSDRGGSNYDYYARSPSTDPTGPSSGWCHVCRGGAWPRNASGCRSASRNEEPPGREEQNLGFRVSLQASAEHTREVITNSLGMKLVRRTAGEFPMGSPESPEALAKEFDTNAEYFEDERPQHPVKITETFYLGATEVTQEQYERVMGENPSHFKGDPQRPVETVSWEDAVEFCRRLSEKESKTYRLPTEAEWEYACRAGTTTKWCFGDSQSKLTEYAWCDNNSDRRTHPVAQKKPNTWGLYDMHGNVWEWCLDRYGRHYYEFSPAIDPRGPSSGAYRVSRGGSWDNSADECRSADRHVYPPGVESPVLGFRVLLVLAEEAKE